MKLLQQMLFFFDDFCINLIKWIKLTIEHVLSFDLVVFLEIGINFFTFSDILNVFYNKKTSHRASKIVYGAPTSLKIRIKKCSQWMINPYNDWFV